MDQENWRSLEQLFERVADLSLVERQAYYGAEDVSQSLQDQVEKLIAVEASRGEDEDANGLTDAVLRAAEEELGVGGLGRGIDGYEIIQELGRGGQGVVYLARRSSGELRGRVAIKLLKTPSGTEIPEQRFRQERRILSGLEHPNIARFLDAGTTEGGRLYLVLEAVEGLPIHDYCEQQDLSLNQRLDLFCAAAGAVQAAHRQLIIHRDLKAGNILVTHEGAPKLLDFGIAKLLDAESSMAETRPGSHHLTPEAASPEQVRGELLTTATDIYSLGLLLYRLLSGRRAYSFDRGVTASEMERVICEVDPPLPSQVSGRRALRGDLDTIVMKALRKSPQERFVSVEAMVEDIRRFQRQEPIRAMPAGWFYRGRKFLRRHYRPLLVTAGVLLLSGFFVLQLKSHYDRAILAEAFLLSLLSDPDQGFDGQIVTERAQKFLDSLEDDSRLKKQTLPLVSQLHRFLGNYDKARENLRDATRGLRESGVGIEGIAELLLKSGIVEIETGKFTEAEKKLTQALGLAIENAGSDSWLVANCLTQLARLDFERGNLEAAGRVAVDALNIRRQWLSSHSTELFGTKKRLDHAENLELIAGVRYQVKDFDGAEELFRQALDVVSHATGREHQEVASLLSNLGMALRRQGRLDEAEQSFLEAARIDRALLGDKSLRLGIRLLNLGNNYRRQGRYDEAIAVCTEALEMTVGLRNEEHRNVPRIRNCIARAESAKEEMAPVSGNLQSL